MLKHASKVSKIFKMSKMNEILVANGERRTICRLLKVSEPTVRKALRGERATDIALKIRKLALDRGGVEKPKC